MVSKSLIQKLLFLGLFFFILGLGYLKSIYYFERHAVEKIKTSPREKIEKFDYKIVLVGDSHIEYLGNLEELEYFLHKYYPQKKLLLLNYGYSSTNILSLQDRLEKDSFHNNRVYQAINDIDFDLILIESFGNNPLAQYPLEEGLRRQTEALDQAIASITKKHPKSSIVFVATIAPTEKYYGLNTLDLSTEIRKEWADVRSTYVLNHIAYAKAHNIPIIDIYHQSQTAWRDGTLKYINKLDHIHPSLIGIFYIDDQIARFIYKNRLLRE